MAARLITQRSRALAGLVTMVALVLALPGTAHAGLPVTTAVPAENITVEVVAINGSGCSPGTARVTSEPDRTGFRVSYRDFIAVAGSSDATDARKNCQVAVLVGVPAGWTFAIAEAEYRGNAKLNAGAAGLHRTSYYWQGSSDTSFADRTFTGPMSSLWSTSALAPVVTYQPCGAQRILNINTELRVDEGSSAGRSFLSMRSSEGDVDTLFRVNWKKC